MDTSRIAPRRPVTVTVPARVAEPAVVTTALAAATRLGAAVVAARALPSVTREILEDPTHPRTREFVAAQEARSEAVLAAVPLRGAITQRVKELAATNPPPRYESRGNLFAIERGSLTVSTAGATEVLIDATKLGPGHAVTDFVVSPDGAKVLYGVAPYGDDFTNWFVLDIASKTVTDGPFLQKNVPATWDYDSKGFFYNPTASKDEDEHARPSGIVRYHKLGADPVDDALVFEDPDQPTASRYNIRAAGPDAIYVSRNQGVAEIPLSTRKIERTGGRFGAATVDMVAPGHDRGKHIHTTPSAVFFRTSGVGDNFGVISVDASTRAQKLLVAPDPQATMLSAQVIGGKLVMQYMRRDFTNVIRIASLDGTLEREISMAELGMPGRGTLSQFSGDALSATTEFTYQSVQCPPETFSLDLTTFTLVKRPRAAIAYDGTKISDSLHTTTSKDGTPLTFEVYERNDVPTKRTFIFQYGAIGIANSSQWNRIHQLMLEMGYRVVIVHARGGGEAGNDWMDQGTFHKQRTLDDIQAVQHYARATWPRDTITLSGRSFGGMHTLNRLLADPNAADAYIPVVPVTDPERALYAQSGWWARDDYGFPRDARGNLLRHDVVAKARLHRWNPWTLLKRAKVIKPVFLFTANHDTRVGRQQTYVMTHALQQKFGEAAPVFMKEHIGGHAARAELADMATYLAGLFGITELSRTV